MTTEHTTDDGVPREGTEWEHQPDDIDGYEYPVEVTHVNDEGDMTVVFYEVTDGKFLEERVRAAEKTREDGGNVAKTVLDRFVTEQGGGFVPAPEGAAFGDFREQFEPLD